MRKTRKLTLGVNFPNRHHKFMMISVLSVFFVRGFHRSRFGVNGSETFGYAGPVFICVDERPQEKSKG